MIRSLSSVAPALTTIRAHLAGVAAPLLRRAVSALQRAANTCESAAVVLPTKPVSWTTEGGLPYYDYYGVCTRFPLPDVEPGTEPKPILGHHGLPSLKPKREPQATGVSHVSGVKTP
jgi:hypothetical protein